MWNLEIFSQQKVKALAELVEYPLVTSREMMEV